MTDPILRIDAYAFSKFLYMRDYKEAEITMFGITKPEDPLFVTDFRIVKQIVSTASSDCDKDYMAEYIGQNVMKGIMPINCERVWCHTHPMTGENSANPSGKDMATWNDKDNELKNFMVMMILSRSGQMTCKLRVRGNLNAVVTGMNHPFIYERDIKIEIINTPEYLEKLKVGLINVFGEKAVEKLGDKANGVLIPQVSLIELFPEFVELEEEYSKLVSTEPVRVHTPHHIMTPYKYNPQNYADIKKKKVCPEIVPELLLRISEHKTDFTSISANDLSILKNNYDGIDDITVLNKLEEDFTEAYGKNEDDIVSALLGAISGDLLDTAGGKLVIKYKDSNINNRYTAINVAKTKYPNFKNLAARFNTETL